jgi:hypothetical protein
VKLLTLLSLSIIVTNTAMSQINKGQFLVGGNISFESVRYDERNVVLYKDRTFLVSPNIGYFFIPKLAGGLRLNCFFYKQTTSVFTETDISLSPFLRYYLLSQKQKFNVLVDASYFHSRSKTRFINNPTPAIGRTNGYNVSVGPSIFLNEHIALEFLVGYKHTKGKDLDNKTITVNTALGLQVHLGKIKNKSKV